MSSGTRKKRMLSSFAKASEMELLLDKNEFTVSTEEVIENNVDGTLIDAASFVDIHKFPTLKYGTAWKKDQTAALGKKNLTLTKLNVLVPCHVVLKFCIKEFYSIRLIFKFV